MKKLLLLLLALVTLTVQGNAAKKSIHMEVSIGNSIPGGQKPQRAPMYLPIEVYYDDETNQVEVIGDYDKPVEIYLCDEDLDVVSNSH